MGMSTPTCAWIRKRCLSSMRKSSVQPSSCWASMPSPQRSGGHRTGARGLICSWRSSGPDGECGERAGAGSLQLERVEDCLTRPRSHTVLLWEQLERTTLPVDRDERLTREYHAE